jgi:hypothetical protein
MYKRLRLLIFPLLVKETIRAHRSYAFILETAAVANNSVPYQITLVAYFPTLTGEQEHTFFYLN